MGVYDIVAKVTEWGLISPKWILPTGVILFFVFGIFAIIKYARKTRKIEDKAKELENNLSKKSEGLINVKSENQSGGITAGRIEKLVYSDNSKKKEVLNKLERLLQELVNDIVSYKVYSEKRKSAKTRANNFWEFSQSNIAEMSPVLNKLVFNKMFPEVRNVIDYIDSFWKSLEYRDELILQKFPFEELPITPKMDGIEEKMVDLQNKIHNEIYRILNA